MQDILIATKNPGKYGEILDFLRDLPFRFVSLNEFDWGENDLGPEEDGDTFKENAYKKASYFFERAGILTLAEDSGIWVDALKNDLGVKTRRWGAGEKAEDKEWIDYFMDKMADVECRGARFVCSACLFDGENPVFFEGETNGVITEKLEAPLIPGIPLSSCFLPEGMDKVYAALSIEEKNKISHRGKAIRQIGEFLKVKF